ncbi:MAG: glycosyltransferase family 4 protein [bacterium]|nr:glycosyltransferase family 4 protein [bacterium]
MKVGFISSSSFQTPGGVKNHILNLHHEFEKQGVSSKIIVPKRSRSESAAKYGKDVVLVGTAFPIPFNASQADLSLYFNLLSLRKILKRERFDILHFHNFAFPSILEILSFSNATHILTLHSNPDGSDLVKNLPWLPAMVTKILNWKIQGVIAVSAVAMEMAEGYQGPRRIIPNGVNTGLFRPDPFPSSGFKHGSPTILFVGRLEERKGLLLLLEALLLLQKKHSAVRLQVVGEGEERKACDRFLKKHGMKNVQFLGKKTDEDLAKIYREADVFCSPALYGESFGIVLLEAMASGLPVVAFANRGYEQFLEDTKGEAGLVPVGDPLELSNTLDTMLSDHLLRKELGLWGAKEAQKYDWPVIAKQVLDFYKEVLALYKTKNN